MIILVETVDIVSDFKITMYFITLIITVLNLSLLDAARILICVPFPSISHQVVFYPLINRLLEKGHEVVYITTDVMYPKERRPVNLTEIDTHEVSYGLWKKKEFDLQANIHQGNVDDVQKQVPIVVPLIAESFVLQMMMPEVQDLIKKKTRIDLVIVEGICKSTQVLSHVFNASMIVMSSLGGSQNNYRTVGVPIYPKLIYPMHWHQKLTNFTLFYKIKVLWDTYKIDRVYDVVRVQENLNVKRLFGADTPSLEELGNNVDMLFLNLYPIWEFNRPVPPNVIHIGGIHQQPKKDLPKELQTYLDSSKNGVVYFSMGTNCNPSTLSEYKIQAITNALARVDYDVLIKWDSNDLPGKGNNTRVVKWLPQSDLLRHPNIKAFITQGGLQSFDEALIGGVPLVGIPLFADQWYNVARFVTLKVGVGIFDDITEDKLVNAINTITDDPSYRRNMIELRERVHDQPESALDRAVWWTEHVIRHKGAKHLRVPAANMSWLDYLDIELWATLALAAITILAVVGTTLYLFLQLVERTLQNVRKSKAA